MFQDFGSALDTFIASSERHQTMNFISLVFEVEYSLEAGGNTANVCGTVINKLDREIGTALLSFHFYDAEDVRLCQEQVFVNEIEPHEKVRFAGAIVVGSNAIRSVRLVKAEPIPTSDFPELGDFGGNETN